jgi:hypothetical protein
MVFIYGSVYFDKVHYFIWYFLSTVIVVLIWIYNVKKFKIKSIPVYSDLKWVILSFKKEVKKTKKDVKKTKTLKDKKTKK